MRKNLSVEHRKKISIALKKYRYIHGNPNSPFKHGHKLGFKKGYVPWNKETKGLTKHTPESKEKLSIAKRGNKNPNFGKKPANWKGGHSSFIRKLRDSLEYKLWRAAVFERDNYTCVWCGKRGGELNADHIKPFAYFPEFRFAIDNGRTLCLECHKTTDTYTWKAQKMYK